MIKHIVLLAMLSMCAHAESYIIPARADLGFAAASLSMPASNWNKCAAWFSAAVPVAAPNTADFRIPNLGPAMADGIITTVTRQPCRVNVNGEWALYFDGVDDCFRMEESISAADLNGTVDYSVTFMWTGGDGGNSYGVKIITTTGKDPWAGTASGTGFYLYGNSLGCSIRTEAGAKSQAIGTILPNVKYTARMSYDGTVMRLFLDNVEKEPVTISSPLVLQDAYNYLIVGIDGSAKNYIFDGYIFDVKISSLSE